MNSKSVVLNSLLVVMVALTSAATRAQITNPDTSGGGGTVSPRSKTCSGEAVSANGKTCTVSLHIETDGVCGPDDGGTGTRYVITATITCGDEVCPYPAQIACGTTFEEFTFTDCDGASSITVSPPTTGSGWSSVLGPGGSCDNVSYDPPPPGSAP